MLVLLHLQYAKYPYFSTVQPIQFLVYQSCSLESFFRPIYHLLSIAYCSAPVVKVSNKAKRNVVLKCSFVVLYTYMCMYVIIQSMSPIFLLTSLHETLRLDNYLVQ